jgi:[acyl-carrier-protein] S-malonyltransferase
MPAPDGRPGLDLKARIGTASLAFRGYDVANLGRSPELLAHPAYGPVVRRFLDDASAVAADALKRPFDLAARVEEGKESDLGTFAEDIALIVAVELAQLALLEEFFGVSVKGARQSFGYSIGEMGALVSGGVFTMEELLPIPLGCADDCAELAADTTLGVVFSRGTAIPLKDVQDLCTEVSSEGRGMVGVSSYLSPNTLLVIGQGDTLDRLEEAIPGRLPEKTMLRRKPHKLPPLHTPLVWQRNIPNRAAVGLYKIGGSRPAPSPRVVSCVTGAASYDALNARDTLIRWVDHPQLLWDVITETLVAGVDLVVHAGPAPNLIPATFERLSNNVAKQFGNRYFQMIGRGFGSRMNRHAWLSRLLPSKAALLRAPHVEHVILEDWLLAQPLA